MDTYTRAKRKVQKKKGFFSHLGVYLVMSVFFVIVNAMEPHEVWCVYPIASWGIGLAIHYLSVFGFPFLESFRMNGKQMKLQRRWIGWRGIILWRRIILSCGKLKGGNGLCRSMMKGILCSVL